MKKRHADGAPDTTKNTKRIGDGFEDSLNAEPSVSNINTKHVELTTGHMDIDLEIRSLPYKPSLSSLPIKHIDGMFQLTGPMFDPTGEHAKRE